MPSIKLIRLALATLLFAFVTPANAHPHIFVDAKATLTFDADGRLLRIHNQWTFDDAYSAWAVQGLDANGDGTITREELQSLANDNMKGLADYHFYTFAGEGSTSLEFPRGSNPTLDYNDRKLTLNFDVAPVTPYAIASSLELAVNDPEYYVGITFSGADAIELVNAPATCRFVMEKGHPMPDDVARELYALPPDVTKLPPKLEVALRGVQGGVQVNCAGGTAGHGTSVAPPAPATALEAVNRLAATTPETPAGATDRRPSVAPAIAGIPYGLVGALSALVVLGLGAAGFFIWRSRRR